MSDEAVSVFMGDVNRDGSVSADDARFILRYSVGLEAEKSGTELLYLNIDGDNTISASDARAALRISVGLDKAVAHKLQNVKISESTCIYERKTEAACEDCNKVVSLSLPLLPHVPYDYPCNGITHCTVCKTSLTVEAAHRFSDYRCSSCEALDTIRVRNDIIAIAQNKGISENGVFTYKENADNVSYYLRYNQKKDDLTLLVESQPDGSASFTGIITLKDSLENFEILFECRIDNISSVKACYEITKSSLSADDNSFSSLVENEYEGAGENAADIKRLAHGYSVSLLLWLDKIMSSSSCPVGVFDLGFSAL